MSAAGHAMLRLAPAPTVYLACGVTDLRNNIDGLALIVQKSFCLDPFSPALFVFCNRQRDKIKILFWDKNGFWLFYRRLEEGTFEWPEKNGNGRTLEVTAQQLSWVLDGLSVNEPGAHKEVLKRKLI